MTASEKKWLVARLIERGEVECARVLCEDWGLDIKEA